MRTQKPTTVVVTLQIPLVVPVSTADVAQQEAALKEDLGNLLKGGPFPLKHATINSVVVAATIEPAAGKED